MRREELEGTVVARCDKLIVDQQLCLDCACHAVRSQLQIQEKSVRGTYEVLLSTCRTSGCEALVMSVWAEFVHGWWLKSDQISSGEMRDWKPLNSCKCMRVVGQTQCRGFSTKRNLFLSYVESWSRIESDRQPIGASS